MFTREKPEVTTGLWQQVAAEAERAPIQTGFYKNLEAASSPANFRPQARPDVQAKKLQGRAESYYMLKTPEGKYMRLVERDFFLWERMDGQQDLTRLALLYHREYKAFALERILGLVEKLHQNGFLTQKPAQVYRQINPPKVRRNFLVLDFPLRGLDKPLGWLYRNLGRWLFTQVFGLISLVVILAGFFSFWQNVQSGRYYVLSPERGWIGEIIGLLAAYGLSVFLHEIAHALSVKHFGGEVQSGGFLLYYGMPAFYINTSDIWMYSQKPRLLTSAAGPYTNLLIGGLCSLAVANFPDSPVAMLLFSVAVFCYLGAIFNLNILLELDGYYLLMDWLDFPALRRRAFDFIRHRLMQKVWRREKFNREEYLLGGFGLLALFYTGLMLVYLAWSLQTQVTAWFNQLLQGQDLAGRLLSGVGNLLLLAMVAAIGFQLFSQVWRWVYARITTNMLALAIFLNAWLPILLLPGANFYLAETIALSLAGIGLAMFQRKQTFYSGLSPIWLIAALTMLVACYNLPGLTALMALWLLVCGVRLAGYLDLDNLERPVRWGVSVFVVGSLIPGLPGVIWEARRGANFLTCFVAGLTPGVLCLTLVPLGLALYRQHRTRFGYAHLQFSLGVGCFLLAMLSAGWSGEAVKVIWVVLGWNLISCFLLYRQAFQLSYRLPERQAPQEGLPDVVRLRRATHYLLEITLELVQATFSPHTARQVANRLNLAAVASGWELRINATFEVEDQAHKSNAAMSPAEVGQKLAQVLATALDLLGQHAGETYTRALLPRCLDALHWEERELAEEYILPWLGEREKANLDRRQEVERLLASVPLFAECNAEQLGNLARACREQKYKTGATIIREGETGTTFYLVKSGRVSVWQKSEKGESQVNLHTRGGYFGELALLQAAPRNATCRAETESELLVWHKADFDRLARRYFELAERVPMLYRRLKLLQKLPLFKEVAPQTLKEMAGCLHPFEFGAGEAVVRQGEAGDFFYLIESGEVEILVDLPDGTTKVIERRSAGDFFGEVALLLNTPRTATVRAVSAAQLLGLNRDDFLALVAQSRQPQSLERVATRRLLSVQAGATNNLV